MATAPEDVRDYDYGDGIKLIRVAIANGENRWKVTLNGNLIGVYSSFFNADLVGAGLSKAAYYDRKPTESRLREKPR